MRLVIDEYGLSIGKKENRFEIRKKGKVVEEISADKVDQIIVINASAITTDAMRLAVKHYIDIVVLGDFGIPEARIFPCSLGGTNLTKHNQALAYQNREGYSIGQKLIWAKVKNQQYFVRSLNKTRDIAKLKDAEQKYPIVRMRS